MKFRRETTSQSAAESSRDTNLDANMQSSQEMRELAEAVSLYRSAMHHVAEQHGDRPFVAPQQSGPSWRMRLLLVPALAAAVAAAVIAPAIGRLHHPAATNPSPIAHVQTAPAETVASVDDTELMNRIDSDLAEEVPDALQPLADLSEQAATTNHSVTEKKHVTQE